MSTLNLFAGARGWEVGASELDAYGLELDDDANATARAAGCHGRKADVRATDPLRFLGTTGLIASPPCPSFSTAGKGFGKLDMPRLERGLGLMAERGEWVQPFAGGWHDERSALVLEPLRFIFALRPLWIALEQVPPVLPLWRLYGKVLATLGYRGAAANLHAEQYGRIFPCPLHTARSVELLLAHAIGRVNVRGGATTRFDSEWTPLARNAVADWVTETGRDAASVATWLEREMQVATKEGWARTMRTGEEGGLWTSAATSEFGLTVDTAESIAWSWKRWLAGHSLERRWFTTSTDRRTTIIRAILSCIAVTLTTSFVIGQATSAAGCGLCCDAATPQTRKRAILVAHREKVVALPAPTHRKYRKGVAQHEGDLALKPWVSMAEALGVDDFIVRSNYGTGGDPKNRGERSSAEPSATVTQKIDRNIVYRSTTMPNSARPLSSPAPTVTFGHDANSAAWVHARPATTICADSRVFQPGGHHKPGEQSWNPLRVSVIEAGVLQSFPSDHPWQGSKTAQYLQVGNAIPPLLAGAVLRAARGES